MTGRFSRAEPRDRPVKINHTRTIGAPSFTRRRKDDKPIQPFQWRLLTHLWLLPSPERYYDHIQYLKRYHRKAP